MLHSHEDVVVEVCLTMKSDMEEKRNGLRTDSCSKGNACPVNNVKVGPEEA